MILHNQNANLGARSAARRAAVSAEQKPVISQLRSRAASEVGSTSLVNAVIVKATASQAQALAGNSAVAEVVPNQVIPGPTLPVVQAARLAHSPVKATIASNLCGTSATPELDPEALTKINGAVANPNADGAGITVATIADGLDPANPDFQRNAAYASAGSAAGSPMVTQVDFTGDTGRNSDPRRRDVPGRKLDRCAGQHRLTTCRSTCIQVTRILRQLAATSRSSATRLARACSR